MQKLSELAAALAALTAINERDRAETLTKLLALQTAIDAMDEIPADVLMAFNGLKSSIEARDLDVEPAPAPEPEPVPGQ